MAKPAVDRLERELESEMEVVRLSVSGRVGREMAVRHGVRGVPTFLLFDGGGQLVQHQVGRLNSAQVKEVVEALGR